MNYRLLNQITKRNVYSISLIEKTLIKIIDCKYNFKLNIIVVFNKLRMNKNNENFTTFICSLNIYKYHVFSFELINDLTNFQHYMNDFLFEFINDFCQVYLDDILIYNKTRKKHNRHLRLIDEKFIEIELQIDIDKCEFFKQKVVFLNCIIFIFEIRMNFKNIEVIINWLQLTCLKKVQNFVDFCNFYKRFIKNFFKLVKFFTRMTKKKVDFKWFSNVESIFQTLKKNVIEVSILRHYDCSKSFVLKCDSFNWMFEKILSQLDEHDVLHSIAFFNKNILLVECNYEIYDKELFAIIRCLKHWRSKFESTKNLIKVLIDHKGLEIFMHTKKLISCQVRWVEILVDFNIKIQYQTSSQNVKVDVFTRMLDSKSTKSNDKQLYREQVFFLLLFERVLQINKNDENC